MTRYFLTVSCSMRKWQYQQGVPPLLAAASVATSNRVTKRCDMSCRASQALQSPRQSERCVISRPIRAMLEEVLGPRDPLRAAHIRIDSNSFDSFLRHLIK
ncbi:unnamed protein product [Nippostrongylus brasiliensis]|uniref:Uncharacterized protein n=1 Tax=Nippostrongylus brasiliensis TaxID=27835 RepID=A0A0N4YTF0_NIPBR|nr:unnamed protein product [Nippostrongylus brasiliensis]